MTEWTELKDLQAVAKAQADGWEIEVRYYSADDWVSWGMASWNNLHEYRGRPKAERKVVRVREAVMQYGDQIWVISGNDSYLNNSSKSFLGWVKGSEWREVEYE